jgi:hypothetical protein
VAITNTQVAVYLLINHLGKLVLIPLGNKLTVRTKISSIKLTLVLTRYFNNLYSNNKLLIMTPIYKRTVKQVITTGKVLMWLVSKLVLTVSKQLYQASSNKICTMLGTKSTKLRLTHKTRYLIKRNNN